MRGAKPKLKLNCVMNYSYEKSSYGRIFHGFLLRYIKPKKKSSLTQKPVGLWVKFMSLLRWGYILGLWTFLALCYFHGNFLAFP
jgi:hypothetical protein